MMMSTTIVPFFYSKSTLDEHMKQQGLTSKEAHSIQIENCQNIIVICRSLGFPYYTANTAQHLFHQFYAIHSFSEFPIKDVVIACVFLACKMEETIKKLRDILSVANLILTMIPVDSKTIDIQKKHIIDVEQRLLESCGFNFQFTQPHRFVIKICKKLTFSKEIARLAWNIVENTFKTLLSIQYPPHSIAFTALLIAKYLNHSKTSLFFSSILPMNTDDLMWLDIHPAHILDIASQIFLFYSQSDIPLEEKRAFASVALQVFEHLEQDGKRRISQESNRDTVPPVSVDPFKYSRKHDDHDDHTHHKRFKNI